MSRANYTEDFDEQWHLIMWRGAVKSAIRGKRGQAFLREMLAALDALPEPRLIKNDLQRADEYCALGAVGRKRRIDMCEIDPEDHSRLAKEFGIAPAMVREIEWENDEGWYEETPEKRWQRVRRWVVENLQPAPPEERT